MLIAISQYAFYAIYGLLTVCDLYLGVGHGIAWTIRFFSSRVSSPLRKDLYKLAFLHLLLLLLLLDAFSFVLCIEFNLFPYLYRLIAIHYAIVLFDEQITLQHERFIASRPQCRPYCAVCPSLPPIYMRFASAARELFGIRTTVDLPIDEPTSERSSASTPPPAYESPVLPASRAARRRANRTRQRRTAASIADWADRCERDPAAEVGLFHNIPEPRIPASQKMRRAYSSATQCISNAMTSFPRLPRSATTDNVVRDLAHAHALGPDNAVSHVSKPLQGGADGTARSAQ